MTAVPSLEEDFPHRPLNNDGKQVLCSMNEWRRGALTSSLSISESIRTAVKPNSERAFLSIIHILHDVYNNVVI